MRPRISIRGYVRWSIGPLVHSQTACHVSHVFILFRFCCFSPRPSHLQFSVFHLQLIFRPYLSQLLVSICKIPYPLSLFQPLSVLLSPSVPCTLLSPYPLPLFQPLSVLLLSPSVSCTLLTLSVLSRLSGLLHAYLLAVGSPSMVLPSFWCH